MNRWIAPLVTAALLAPGAVVLGWNGSALALAAVRPWTSRPATTGSVDHRGSVPSISAPAPRDAPTTAPSAVPLLAAEVPSSETPVSTVHKTGPQPVEEPVSHPDDQRGTDSGPEPHPDASPVPVTDPEHPDAAPPAPTTPGGQPIPDGGYVDEDGHRFYSDGSSGNIPVPPKAEPDPGPDVP